MTFMMLLSNLSLFVLFKLPADSKGGFVLICIMDDGSISIGGSKGHVEETVTDQIFIKIYNFFTWRMITNCTGRYTCRDHKEVSHLPPVELLRNAGFELAVIDDRLKKYFVSFEDKRKDPIYVIPFADNCSTGLITYVKMNENDQGTARYVHTLNSESGFRRKLHAINVVLSDDYLVDMAHKPIAEDSGK